MSVALPIFIRIDAVGMLCGMLLIGLLFSFSLIYIQRNYYTMKSKKTEIELREEILGLVSHEQRTQINGIRGFSMIIIDMIKIKKIRLSII